VSAPPLVPPLALPAALGLVVVIAAATALRDVAVGVRGRGRAFGLAGSQPASRRAPHPSFAAPIIGGLGGLVGVVGRTATAASDVAHAAALESIARALRSGTSLSEAIAALAAEGRRDDPADLAPVVARLRRGAPLVDALGAWSTERADGARVLAGAALTFGAEVGGAPARSLDAAAAGLRDRAALTREVRALSAQARASAVVMAASPVAFLVLAGTTDPRVPRSLLSTPAGLVCLVVGAALDLAGAAWMAALIRRVR
jgi:tight adherence protein B